MIRNFKEYQEEVNKLSFVKDKKLPSYVYPAFGLAGEAGEVLEQIKKSIRENDGSYLTEERTANIRLELGDVLFYIGMLATALNLNMEDIATANIEKLITRRNTKKKI